MVYILNIFCIFAYINLKNHLEMRKKQISTKELSKILVKSILDEPYLNEEILIPKVKALITGFRFATATTNYNAIRNPTKVAKMIRKSDLQNLEKQFWISELKDLVDDKRMELYYLKLDNKRDEWERTEIEHAN